VRRSHGTAVEPWALTRRRSKSGAHKRPQAAFAGEPLSAAESGAILGAMDYKDFITIEPGKRGGKPCVRGLRITVYDVLEYLASGMSEDEILQDFPDLTREDIRACLAFAADRERRLVSASGS